MGIHGLVSDGGLERGRGGRTLVVQALHPSSASVPTPDLDPQSPSAGRNKARRLVPGDPREARGGRYWRIEWELLGEREFYPASANLWCSICWINLVVW